MNRLISLAVTLICCSCSILKAFPDNPIEQKVEEIIEDETGIDIDFSGDSKQWLLSWRLLSS